MDSHMSYLPLMFDAQLRAQQQNHTVQGANPDPRQNPIASTRANLASTSSLPHLPASRTTLQPSQPTQIPPQNLTRAPPRETAQYAASSTSSGASSAASPPTATTTTPMTFERRTRRRRSFRGAANKLARRKSATNGTKVGTIPEDPSSASGTDSKAASEKVSLRSYQYRAFHQADTGSGVPNGDEYAPFHAPPLPAPKAPSEGEYTFVTPQGGPQPSTSSLATSLSTSSEPPTRKSRTLTALALGKRAFREVLGGGGNNNPTDAPGKVTYFGRGGAGTRRSGQLPTIRADSFTPTKNPPNSLPTPARSTGSGYQGSVISSSGYAPSVASAPYTSTQSFGGSSPILSHRSLSPNMFGGSRLSVSSYSGTYATSLYEEDEGWQAPYNGHAQDPRVPRGSQLEIAYPHGPGDIQEESEEYDSESVGVAAERIPETLTYNGPGGEVYIVEQDYSNYPSQDEKHLQPPSNQPYYRDYRSPSTAGSSSNESTPLVHAKDGVLPGLSPPAAALLPQVPPNVPRELPIPLKHQPSNDTLFQANQATLYRQDVPGSLNGAPMFGSQGNVGVMPQSLDQNTALQIQALYANLVAAGATPQNQLYPQQYTALQNNFALLNTIVANGGVLGQSELANALAQLTLFTQSPMQPQQAVMPSVDQLPPPPTYTPYSTNTAPSFPLPSPAVPEMGVQPTYANYQPTPVNQHMNSKDVELAQTLARKRELEKKLLELEIQRLQREQALAPHTIPSYSNNPDMPTGPNYF